MVQTETGSCLNWPVGPRMPQWFWYVYYVSIFWRHKLIWYNFLTESFCWDEDQTQPSHTLLHLVRWCQMQWQQIIWLTFGMTAVTMINRAYPCVSQEAQKCAGYLPWRVGMDPVLYPARYPFGFFPEDWLFRSFRWPRLFFLFNLIESIPATRCPEIVASASGVASHMFLMFAEHGRWLAATGALWRFRVAGGLAPAKQPNWEAGWVFRITRS